MPVGTKPATRHVGARQHAGTASPRQAHWQEVGTLIWGGARHRVLQGKHGSSQRSQCKTLAADHGTLPAAGAGHGGLGSARGALGGQGTAPHSPATAWINPQP